MNSPTVAPFWHGFAHDPVGVRMPFAMMPAARHCFLAGHRQHASDLRSQRCYPSPSLRSGPSQAGPTLIRGQGHTDCMRGTRYCFEICEFAVESAAITTNLRGSIPCASRLSSLSSFPCRSPVACRTPRRAALPVRPRACLSPMQRTVISLPGQSSVALPVSRPAASKSACRPVTRATDTAAFGRTEPAARTIRADRPGGPFLLRLMGEADV